VSAFARGSQVVWRSRPQGCIGYVKPMIVVEDGSDITVLFQPSGTVCKRRAGARGGPRGRLLLDWSGEHADRVYDGPPMLHLHVWGTAHGVLRSWSFDSNRAEGWYVNLEAPWRRTAIGFDSEDYFLDVTAADDLSSWSWKDEDELEWAVEVGRYTPQDADEFRREGRRAGAAIERREFPFVDDWSRWGPDPDWPVPVVAEGWDTVPPQ